MYTYRRQPMSMRVNECCSLQVQNKTVNHPPATKNMNRIFVHLKNKKKESFESGKSKWGNKLRLRGVFKKTLQFK